MNTKYLEESMAKSKIKQDLFKVAITSLISEKKEDFDYIQKCFEVLKEEQSTQKQLEDYFQKEINGENEKRADAKRRLGLGG